MDGNGTKRPLAHNLRARHTRDVQQLVIRNVSPCRTISTPKSTVGQLIRYTNEFVRLKHRGSVSRSPYPRSLLCAWAVESQLPNKGTHQFSLSTKGYVWRPIRLHLELATLHRFCSPRILYCISDRRLRCSQNRNPTFHHSQCGRVPRCR